MPRTNDRERVLAMNQQLALIRRLREDFSCKKEDAKLAKERVSRAVRDFELLADDRGQQDLFAGALVLDHKTGEIKDYRGIGEEDDEVPAASVPSVREALGNLQKLATESDLSIELTAGSGPGAKTARIEPKKKGRS